MTLKVLQLRTVLEKYSSTTGIMEGEVGKIDEVRFVETVNAKVFAGEGKLNIDVYATIIFGSDAYGTTRIFWRSNEEHCKTIRFCWNC